MRRIEIAKILRNESDFLAKYFLSKLSEISNFNRVNHTLEALHNNYFYAQLTIISFEHQTIEKANCFFCFLDFDQSKVQI